MIERYSRAEMRKRWPEEKKFDAYLKVELFASEDWSELGVVPKEDISKLWPNASLGISRKCGIDAQTRHDGVAAYLY